MLLVVAPDVRVVAVDPGADAAGEPEQPDGVTGRVPHAVPAEREPLVRLARTTRQQSLQVTRVAEFLGRARPYGVRVVVSVLIALTNQKKM